MLGKFLFVVSSEQTKLFVCLSPGGYKMSNMNSARDFFDACETGKGWDVCKKWCHDGATFSAQADALADVTTVQGYII